MRWLPTCLRLLSVGILFVAPLAEAADVRPPVAEANLKGLVFVPGAGAFVANGVSAPAGPVDTSRVALLDRPDFAEQMRSLIGQKLTLATLNQIVPLATQVFVAAGHPAVNITIPEQDVTSGIVQVVVTEFTVGQIVVEGADHFPPDMFRSATGLKPGQTVDMAGVQAGLAQINTSDYRFAEVALRPGTAAGTVDGSHAAHRIRRLQQQRCALDRPETVDAGCQYRQYGGHFGRRAGLSVYDHRLSESGAVAGHP